MDAYSPALAFGLGLIGFVEPCTIGAHMLFLDAQYARPMRQRLSALAVFTAARLAVMGGFGGLIVIAGQRLIGVQTGAWFVFGMVYLLLGLAIVARLDRALRRRIVLSPERWRTASSPLLQGLAFGLNIPACAAPILFALLATATASGSVAIGFLMMAVFAIALSLPLLPLCVAPGLAAPLGRLAAWLRTRRWVLASIFIALAAWSIWFAMFVDPQDWSGR